MRPLVVALFLPAPAFAVTFTVPDDGDLETVLAGTTGGDTIRLRAGTYDVGDGLVVDRSVNFESVDSDVVTLMSTGSPEAMIDIAAGVGVSIEGLSFDGGNMHRAIRATAAITLTLENVQADDLSTTGNGALVEAVDTLFVNIRNTTATGGDAANGGFVSLTAAPLGLGTIDIRDSVFTGGTATGNGGAVYLENAALTVRNSEFTGNSATSGGAIHGSNTEAPKNIQVINTRLESNIADDFGGGIYAAGYGVTFQGAFVVDNMAGSGGGAWLDQDTLVETLLVHQATEFTGNDAIGPGGIGAALYGAFDSATFTSVTVAQSSGTSGSVHLDVADVSATSVDFMDNTSTGAGAGLWILATGDVDLADSTFTNNQAGSDAGALGILAATALVEDSTFADNGASANGGAAWFDGGFVDLRRLTFTDNDATRGGAVYRTGAEADFDIRASDFFRNQGRFGGAAHVDGVANFRVLDNFWCENRTTGGANRGGALRASSVDGTLIVRNDAAADNTSARGGVYDVDGFASVDIQFSTYAGNSANNAGIAEIADVSGQTTLEFIAAIGTGGSAFRGTNTDTLVVGRVAFDNTGADFAGDWAAAVPTNPLTFSGAPVLNSYPAPSCETTRLHPHPESDLLDAGPGNDDIDGSLNDIGMSGGGLADGALFLDGDGDGFLALDDCDDDDANSNPSAPDVCNGFDDDCDGMLDEDPNTQWYTDQDQDGHGVGAAGVTQCDPPDAFSAPLGDDCDDTDDAINPSATEICNGADDDCNLMVDDDASDATEWAQDLDFDGFGTDVGNIFACEAPPGFTDVIGDCDDTLAAVYPGAPENCDTIDNDCDGEADNDPVDAPLWYSDADADGYGRTNTAVQQCLAPLDHAPLGGDCDDADPFRNPGASEVCDGIDNNCSGDIDVDPIGPLYFPDSDSDGFGDASATPVASCSPVGGLLDDGSDCDDTDDTVFPGAQESCNGIDQDCDGVADNNPDDGDIFFLDSDQDGFGNSAFEIPACVQPNFASAVGGDCNDDNDVQFPGNTEVCDFWDNDCDGETDEDDAVDAPTWYADEDNDEYGDDAVTAVACSAPVGFVAQGGDCADTNPTSNPGRAEICDGTDNDCDGEIDGPSAEGVIFFFEDTDGDGFGNPNSQLGSCTQPEGYTSNDDDCDDTNAEIFPGATEVFGNDIDENCDGQAPGDGGPGDTDDTGGDEKCGCSSASSAPWALLPLLAAFGMRRRRQTR